MIYFSIVVMAIAFYVESRIGGNRGGKTVG